MMRAMIGAVAAALAIQPMALVPVSAQTAEPRTIPPPGQGGAWTDFAGTVRCATRDVRNRDCSVPTQNRVVLLQIERGECRDARDWTYDQNRIRVRNRCIATFGYGYANSRPNPPGWGGGNWQDRDFAGTLRCSARRGQQERCYVDTQNRVELLQTDSGTCRAGQNWGFTRDFIWVSGRCSATFGYGRSYGRPQPGTNKDDGLSTGAIIGGVLVAGGLIALLSGKGKRVDKTTTSQFPPKGPARIDANLNLISADARPAVQNCLFEAARQVGALGGSTLRLDNVDNLAQSGAHWRFKANTTSSFPDGEHKTPLNCRATSKQVEDLVFNP